MKMKKRIRKIYDGMHSRCYHENHNRYENYGARGITVCQEWHDFETFYQWAINNGYSDELTIDRIDNDKRYEPSNCRWATVKEQANNRSTNVWVEIDGVTKNLTQWSEHIGVSDSVIRTRYYRDGDRGKDLIRPLSYNSKQSVTINGVTRTYSEWSEITGIKRGTIWSRYKRGKRDEDLIKPV